MWLEHSSVALIKTETEAKVSFENRDWQSYAQNRLLGLQNFKFRW